MKLFKYKDNNEPINYLGTNRQIEIPKVYIKKDFRGVWVSNVINIDLPTVENIDDYKNKVIKMFDTLKEYNINMMFFQVRTTNDAFYKSKLNPYSRYFTGKEGLAPPFDILEWIINESKSRNIEFHAWCNPYRVSFNGKLSIEDYLKTCDDLNFAKKHPEYLILDKGGKLILNPTIKEVKQFIVDSVIELATDYGIDGIHFDDYFYPYSGLSETVNDLNEFDKREDKSISIGDFRRSHVSEVIRDIYNGLKKTNKNIKFGVSPFGIWKNKESDDLGSNTAPSCSESYYNQYADSYDWIKEGIIDYVVPQIYWQFGHPVAPFGDILNWWVSICEKSKVDLFIGHAAYRLGEDGDFENKLEIINQVKYSGQFDTVKGNIFFTYKNFIESTKVKPGMDELKRLLNKE
jgi:uncharacterized lipoprotein YddW (UPF0748 family)